MASEIERSLKTRNCKYLLKPNELGKSDVWKNFDLVFEKQSNHEAPEEDDIHEFEVKYFCVYKHCLKMKW